MGEKDGEETNDKLLNEWIRDVKARHANHLRNIELMEKTERLDETRIRALDSTLKKVTAFMKKLKNIGTTVTPSSLLPELERLNVSKFLDEIASSICEVKIKIADLASLVEFCVRVGSLYAAFPDVLAAEMKKHMPHKKTDKVENPSKLRVDLRLLAELILNGVFQKEGIQLLGAVLSFLVNTDKTEHVNTSILMPLCRSVLFDLTALVPTRVKRSLAERSLKVPLELSSTVFTADQKSAMENLLKSYQESLIKHLNDTRIEMNRLRKSIKRQERTKGDASADDRQRYDQIKAVYDRLLQSAGELSECIGEELPEMTEEPSDDEQDELAAKKVRY
jgi:regulator of nonsense transcripts 2